MSHVMSKDGTSIAFDRTGSGPPLLLVMGAFNDRSAGAPLARLLEADFTVINYDRRGKGKSGDAVPYAIERELEDLDALIEEAGGSAFVFGYSSGAVLALKAAANGAAISRLALYEAPLEGYDGALVDRLKDLIAEGRRGDAVEFFQSEIVGLPLQVVAQLRNAPFRPYLEALAHTTVYDTTIICQPPQGDELGRISAPVLVVAGERSSDSFKQASEQLAAVLSEGRYTCLAEQNHRIEPPILAPVVAQFLRS